MAGLANFKGKQAAPFGKGGKRRKAKAVLAKAKEARERGADRDKDADDLSNVDLAFRFRHGWIPIHSGEEDKHVASGGEGHTIKITHANGTEALYRRTSAHNKAGVAKYENVSGSAGSKTPGEMAAHLRKMRAAGSRIEHKLGNAQRAMSDAYGKSTSLATGVSGHEIDLDWSQWNAAHKGQQRTKKATSKGAVTLKEIKSFKRDNSLHGSGLGKGAQAALKAKASSPGHYRAKAILAAEQGNTKAAKKFEALHLRAAAARGESRRQVRGAPKTKRAPKTSVPAPRAAAPAPVTRTPSTPEKKGVRHPAMVAKRFRTQALVNAAHAAAVRKNLNLSNVDLSTLTAASRAALPASAFVFPKKRAYPIHDKGHATAALARSKGKPEHAAVFAAVRARYPGMGG